MKGPIGIPFLAHCPRMQPQAHRVPLFSTDACYPGLWASHIGLGLPACVLRGAGLFSLPCTFLDF